VAGIAGGVISKGQDLWVLPFLFLWCPEMQKPAGGRARHL
jgi:hypothetical protein